MFNPFKPPELIKAEVFTSLPTRFRKRSRTAWSDPNRQGAEVECFLEGPSFGREGNLWIVDIPFGRIFRISPKREWDHLQRCGDTLGRPLPMNSLGQHEYRRIIQAPVCARSNSMGCPMPAPRRYCRRGCPSKSSRSGWGTGALS